MSSARPRPHHRAGARLAGNAPKRTARARRFYGVLNYLGLYNKNAKILFLVSSGRLARGRLGANRGRGPSAPPRMARGRRSRAAAPQLGRLGER